MQSILQMLLVYDLLMCNDLTFYLNNLYREKQTTIRDQMYLFEIFQKINYCGNACAQKQAGKGYINKYSFELLPVAGWYIYPLSRP